MNTLSLSTTMLGGLLLAGCATPYRTASRPAVHPHPATREAAKPAVATPAVAEAAPEPRAATKVAAPDAGSAIPFMGFRPMRGQTAPGA